MEINYKQKWKIQTLKIQTFITEKLVGERGNQKRNLNVPGNKQE